ncbi:hypothetical protein [Candidatus Pelagibacter sp.]|uniref:hypothetical protein n=1 Tax=Candidatus Pelagibacter sp. TaxID=2024849 RepID=UPI003F85A936
MKKLTLILIFIFVTNCGFSPIYLSNENSIFQSIKKIELKGSQKIGERIKNSLNIKTNNKNNYLIILDSLIEKTSISKNSSNITTGFMMVLSVKISILDDDEIILDRNFKKNFTYNNRDNKFELLKYERSIEENLISEISDEIILYLSLNNDN